MSLLKQLGRENVNITTVKMDNLEFFNFLKWQDLYYRTPEDGEFKQSHIFIIEGGSNGKAPTLLQKNR